MSPLGPIALSLFMAYGQGADAISTRQALQRCQTCREGNALMVNPTVMWTAKGAVVAGASVGVVKLWRGGHKKSAVAVAVIVGGAGLVAARGNGRVGR